MNKSRKFAALIGITIISSVFCSAAKAQDDDGEPHGLYVEQPNVFYGGVVVGANFAQVDGDYYAGYRKIGLNAGGIVYAQLAKHVALSLEILYSQKGSKSDGPQQSPANQNIAILNYGITANYAEVPIMINYFDKRKTHFGIGISYNRLVNSTETITADSAGKVYSPDFNEKYPFKKDCLDFLAGVDFHLWKGLFLDVRFQYSITPMRTDLPPVAYARADQYNNMWAVRFMYLLK